MKKDSDEKLTRKYLNKIDTPTFVDMLYFSTRYALGRLSIASQMLPCGIVEIFKNNEKALEKYFDNYFGDLNREINARLNLMGFDKINIYDKTNNLQAILGEVYTNYKKNNFKDLDSDILESCDLNKIYAIMPWSDLIGGFKPYIKVTLDSGDVFDGFYSIDSDRHVGIKTCDEYLKEPHYSTFLIDNNIINITKI